MCLAIPGKLVSITNPEEPTFRHGKVSFEGIMRDVNLSMVPDAKEGDYVLVHVGVAISIVDEEEAKQTFEYLKIIGEVEESLNCGEKSEERDDANLALKNENKTFNQINQSSEN